MNQKLQNAACSLDRHGYCCINAAIPHTAVRELVGLLVPLAKRELRPPLRIDLRHISSPSTSPIYQLNRPSEINPHIKASAAFQEIRNMLEMMHLSCHFVSDALILKDGPHAPATPWHQDVAYDTGPSDPRGGLTVWVPLDAADRVTGGLRYLVDSHRDGLVRHLTAEATKVRYIADDTMPSSTVHETTSRPGDLCIHWRTTVHGSAEVRGSHSRLAWSLGFELRP